MIIKLENKININELLSYFDFVQKSYPPYMKKNTPWGGWSITSSNGDIYDGWQPGEKIFNSEISKIERNKLKDVFDNNEFNKPTQIYTPYIEKILTEIQENISGIKLSRIRIAVLLPHKEIDAYWHKDSDRSAKFRLHIPIITNENCFFEYENERRHLPADGSIYLIDVSKMHRVLNLSNEIRYHLFADTLIGSL
jgi:hypothetical protein